jgi:hypothetical protein
MKTTPPLAAYQAGAVAALALDKPMSASEREVQKALAWTGLVAAGVAPETAEAALPPGAMRSALPGIAREVLRASATRKRRR